MFKSFYFKDGYLKVPFEAGLNVGPKSRFANSLFWKSECGAMTILTLFLLVIVLISAGFAVDMMRYERERAMLQYSLDRAVLAAADMDQTLCPRDVVKDYLNKDGLDQYLVGEPTVEPDVCGDVEVGTENARLVSATARMGVKTHFMRWSGVDTLTATASSSAEEARGSVEISLVLDISESMEGDRLDDLKAAAEKFVDDIYSNGDVNDASISIVPYNQQVALPDFLFDELNTVGRNSFGNCLDFRPEDFRTSELKAIKAYDPDSGLRITTPSIPQTLHADSKWHDQDTRKDGRTVSNNECLGNNKKPDNSASSDASPGLREVTVFQNDVDVLKSHIQGLEASGYTSIDVGMKWGVALLDDSMKPVIKRLSEAGDVPAVFSDRPSENASSDTLKVIVLMTDGRNTRQEYVNPPFHSGSSDIWWNESEDIYSFYDADTDSFYWPYIQLMEWDADNGWYWAREQNQDHAYGASDTFMQYRCASSSNGNCDTIDYSTTREKSEGETAVELSWPDLWEYSTFGFISLLIGDGFGEEKKDEFDEDSMTKLRYPYSNTGKDENTKAICNEAYSEKIIVFSIAFNAPEISKALLKSCASEDATYYEATGSDISDVFASIASSISLLKLK